jgi:hypothetical protein
MQQQPDLTPVLQFGHTGVVLALAGVSIALGALQIALGAAVDVSAMFAGATFFGLLAAAEAGVFTAIGLLNLVLVGRTLLGAYLAKNAFLQQPISADMLDPNATAAVMLGGFSAVWLATIAVKRWIRVIPIFETITEPRRLMALFLLILIAGAVSAIAVRISGSDGEVLAGGIWGVAKALGSTRNLALPILMMYLWRTGSARWLTHPFVLLLTLVLFGLGVLSTSKQAMAEPLVFFAIMAIARYGWRHPVAWACIPIAICAFQFFILPISQYARFAGGNYKDVRQAAQATADIVVGYVTDSGFREFVRRSAATSGHASEGTAYLPENLVAMGRFALVGEADRLVSASDIFQPTGWDTVVNSLLVAVPHFLYPDKPQLGSGNFLARYTGDLPDRDLTTQVSYGFMANAYNAFGLAWVIPLSLITALLVLAPVALISSGTIFSNPWSMFAVVSLHQVYAESSFSGLFGAFNVPVLAGILLLGAIAVEWVLVQLGMCAGAHGTTGEAEPAFDRPATVR